jgi:acyl carrier protein
MILERIKPIIVEQFDVEEESITADTKFEDIGADSLDIVELVMALEGEFDIEIPDTAIEDITKVGDLVKFIKGKTRKI